MPPVQSVLIVFSLPELTLFETFDQKGKSGIGWTFTIWRPADVYGSRRGKTAPRTATRPQTCYSCHNSAGYP
jgi:hypothetical protein